MGRGWSSFVGRLGLQKCVRKRTGAGRWGQTGLARLPGFGLLFCWALSLLKNQRLSLCDVGFTARQGSVISHSLQQAHFSH